MTNPLENGILVLLYLPLSSKFVSLDHLYIRLPNGTVTNFEANKTYIINAVNADGRTAMYYPDHNTTEVSGSENVFYIRSLSSVLSGGGGIQLSQVRVDNTNQYITTISGAPQASLWVIEYIDENKTAEKNHLYVCQNSNGLTLTLPSNPNEGDRVAIFTLKLVNTKVVNIVSTDKHIQAGQTNDLDPNEPLEIEAVLCYVELHFDGERWHIVKLVTPSDSKIYHPGNGLKYDPHSDRDDTFVISAGPANTFLKSNGTTVFWSNVSTGSEPDGNDWYTYSNADTSLTFSPTGGGANSNNQGNTTIKVNADWFSQSGQGGYNAIYSAVSNMISETNYPRENFSLTLSDSSKTIKFNNPFPALKSSGIWVLVCDNGELKWVEASRCD